MSATRKPRVDAARLQVLAAGGDERAFLEYARELLASGDRMAREATLELLERQPRPRLREHLRALYFELDADGAKRDQGSRMRAAIVRMLTGIGDLRDLDVALAASQRVEIVLGDDLTASLRMSGLRMLATLDPTLFRFIAMEMTDNLEERNVWPIEPAKVAFEILAQFEEWTPIYAWLIRGPHDPELEAFVLELFTAAPRVAVERYVRRALANAVARGHESIVMAMADTIVRLQFEPLYGELRFLMRAKLSDELYSYLAMLLAGADRPPLAAILERELHRGRRPRIVADALRMRPTPRHEAIVARWENGEPLDETDAGDAG